jgi:hypothetical protein
MNIKFPNKFPRRLSREYIYNPRPIQVKMIAVVHQESPTRCSPPGIPTLPESTSPTIQGTNPMGVSESEAIPHSDMTISDHPEDAYAITVESSGNDRPMKSTFVNVNCTMKPAILVDVCREVRTTLREIVSDRISHHMALADMKSEYHKQIIDIHQTYNDTFAQMVKCNHDISEHHKKIVSKLVECISNSQERKSGTIQDPNDPLTGLTPCVNSWCSRIVTKRFRSGKSPRQCSSCLKKVRVNRAKAGAHAQL